MIATLQSVPRVGRKKAEQLVLDLAGPQVRLVKVLGDGDVSVKLSVPPSCSATTLRVSM